MALADLSVTELTTGYHSRAFTPVEVAEAVFERMAVWEPHINALYLLKRNEALAAAKASSLRWQNGTMLSPLDGVPITLKENIYTKGDPAPIGTRTNPLDPKPDDAPIAARCREAGLIITAKTTMPDFGMLSSGQSSFHGITRNPWNLAHNPAGSSSGAGAAAAAGYGPLHVGTDIGGSIRLPAFHCGLFGLKPSLGRIPINPPYIGRVAGPMTRRVADAAALMPILSRPDSRDHMSLPYQDIDYRLDGLALKGLHIGLLTDMGCGLKPDPRVVAATEQAAQALAAEGAHITPMRSFLTPEMLDGMCRFFEARSCNDILALDDATRSNTLPYIVEWATHRARKFTGAEVMDAYTQHMLMREAATLATLDHDFILMPTAPMASYPAEHFSPTNDPTRALNHIAFTLAWNFGEQPAAAVNWSHDGDEPIGIQLVGRRFDDAGVLRLCHLIEQIRPEQAAWPILDQ